MVRRNFIQEDCSFFVKTWMSQIKFMTLGKKRPEDMEDLAHMEDTEDLK